MKDEVLSSYHVFTITAATKDLDRKFEEALQKLDLDLQGKLVQALSLRGDWLRFWNLEKRNISLP